MTLVNPLIYTLGLCGAGALLVNLTGNKKPACAGISLHDALSLLGRQTLFELNQFGDFCLLGSRCVVSRHRHSTPVTRTALGYLHHQTFGQWIFLAVVGELGNAAAGVL